ncbi:MULTISPECIES: hypothetical protein [Achromobacter]|uniref:Uncharacterized protein n=1 Tax=Achromobacter spanius TaxID=217203 RepID=A0ABY8GXB9_9BURK|nr:MULTISPECIES: hypothetical protein [Achromobacter]WAI81476.1 hypothetical protein N8Z00_18270 [Achromobacter spanius]WEX96993.1 hypothetical protein N3Z32_12875 [Achromobacter sp. SS2-2022]WFP09290.1 hypothetical protein P8T11_05235 [Achromobacter spanius]
MKNLKAVEATNTGDAGNTTKTKKTAFGTDLLFLIAGPTIWMTHFLAIYIVNALGCARPRSALAMSALGLPLSSWLILAGTALALAAMALIAARQARRVRARGLDGFHVWLTAALCLLSALAVIWQTVPVFLVAACG